MCVYAVISFLQPAFGVDLLFPLELLFFSLIASRNEFYKALKIEDLFLLFFPIIATVGTDNIGMTLLYFMPCWGLLLALLIIRFDLKFSPDLNTVFFSVVLLISLMFYNLFHLNTDTIGNRISSKERCSEIPPLNNIYVHKEQAAYFQKVKNILKTTKFKERIDGMFSFSSDYITIHIFNGRLVGAPYTHLSHYMADRFNFQAHIEKPKYVFVDSTSLSILSRCNDWDFPRSYTKYFVGSPEINYKNTNRWLFCLKKI